MKNSPQRPEMPVNFLNILPAEVRNEIFRYLIPSVSSCNPDRRKDFSNFPGWMSVNRQMSAEICSVLYHDCNFEFTLVSFQEKPKDQGSRFIRFLKKIGRDKASQIRSITICLKIYPGLWAVHGRLGIPSIASILRAIDKECDFQTDISSIPGAVVSKEFPNEYKFRIPTRVGRTLIVKICLDWNTNPTPDDTHLDDEHVVNILKMSLGLIRTSG